ncbi:hypothetical protein G9A89_003052 [Geosiphon pyriformis]|nr:hypothetical protein G9A89_003052 [Geosiphon pyriformis]
MELVIPLISPVQIDINNIEKKRPKTSSNNINHAHQKVIRSTDTNMNRKTQWINKVPAQNLQVMGSVKEQTIQDTTKVYKTNKRGHLVLRLNLKERLQTIKEEVINHITRKIKM